MKIQTSLMKQSIGNQDSSGMSPTSNGVWYKKTWNSLITVISWARRSIDLSAEHILKPTSSAEKLRSLAPSQMSLNSTGFGIWSCSLAQLRSAGCDTPRWALAKGYLQSQHVEVFAGFIPDSVSSLERALWSLSCATPCNSFPVFFYLRPPHTWALTHFSCSVSIWQTIPLNSSFSIQSTISDFSARQNAYRTKVKIYA